MFNRFGDDAMSATFIVLFFLMCFAPMIGWAAGTWYARTLGSQASRNTDKRRI